MGVVLSRATSLTAGMLAVVLAGGLGLSAALPAAASAPQVVKDQSAATAPARRALQPASFKVASFNVLGYNHTLNGARGMADGVTRIGWANQLLGIHRVSVAGFQELQAPQVKRFLEITAGTWALYPGLTVRGVDSDNSIGWRTDKFSLVRATTVKLPYFDGIPRSMPVVLLRHNASGMMTYFANFHNPADTAQHPNQGRWRLEASRVEIALQNQLVTEGIPRIMTGDMNERAPYFCRVTRNGTPLHTARPESVRVRGVCHPGRPRFVDWIFGSLRATFTYYTEDDGALDHRASDHPVIVSRVTVSPEALPRGWASSPPAPFVPRVSY
jgi:hypothetical protein